MLRCSAFARLPVAAALASLCFGMPVRAAAPPYGGTAYLEPGIMRSDEPTDFLDARFIGPAERGVFDQRCACWSRRTMLLFVARFRHGIEVEFQVNPELDDDTGASTVVHQIASALGRVPVGMRTSLRSATIHAGDYPHGGGSNNLLVHAGRAKADDFGGFLEEVLFHECGHITYDQMLARHACWTAAQASDPEFISDYALQHPTGEDVAESVLVHFALRHRPDRLRESDRLVIARTIPARLACIDGSLEALRPQPRTIDAWGSNWAGQIAFPPNMGPASAIGAGANHSLAIDATGSVWAWGNDSSGQCRVPSIAGACTAVTGGWDHSLALTSAGRVVAWGSDAFGQCQVPATAKNATAIAAGARHSLARTTTGSIVGWGSAASGPLAPPTPSVGYSGVSSGDWHAIATETDGRVRAWGDNSAGQLAVPASLGPCTAVAAGYAHSLALRSDGSVIAWGAGTRSLPNGGDSGSEWGQSLVPTSAVRCVAIAAANQQSIALREDGSLLAWGRPTAGACDVPANLGHAIAIAAGSWHTLCNSTPIDPCPADLDGNRIIDLGDLAMMMLEFGPCPPGHFADLDGSGTIDFGDLAAASLEFGSCP